MLIRSFPEAPNLNYVYEYPNKTNLLLKNLIQAKAKPDQLLSPSALSFYRKDFSLPS